MPVSVVIPAHDGQAKLDLTLAALSRPTYPAGLLEVVVVDDGSDPPLQLPTPRPKNCQLVRIPDDTAGWGRAFACHAGAEAADGEVIHWLDADMIPYPDHVEAQVRWHHVLPDAVTIGYKRFIDAALPTPDEIVTHADQNRVDELFSSAESAAHEWVERFIDRRDGLRRGKSVYHVHVGATAALRRDLYYAAGGMDVTLHLGEDTELGYRLEQAGAIFIPEPRARSWHLGHSSMMRDGGELRRYNRPFLEHRMPLYPRWRTDPGRQWAVPAVVAVVEVAGHRPDAVEDCVSRLLASYDDLRVVLVGPWDRLASGRRDVLDDPDLDLRILRAGVGADARVSLATEPPATVFPSPLRLDVPADCAVGVRTVGRLVNKIESDELGLIEVIVSSGDTADQRAVVGAPARPDAAARGRPAAVIRLWRTSAVNRARRVMEPDEDLRAVVDQVWGRATVDGRGLDVQLTPPVERGERIRLGWQRLETETDVAELERRLNEQARKLAQVRTPWGWARDRGGYVLHRLRRREGRRFG